MNKTLKQEVKAAFDPIQFTKQEKAAMVKFLMAQPEPKAKGAVGKGVLVALAACLALGLLTGAAVYTRWAAGAEQQYNPTQKIKEQAEKSGLSVVMTDNTGTTPAETQAAPIDTTQPYKFYYNQQMAKRCYLFDPIWQDNTLTLEFSLGVIEDNPEPQGGFAYPLQAVLLADGSRVAFTSSQGGFFESEGRRHYKQVCQPAEGEVDPTQITSLILSDGQGGEMEVPLFGGAYQNTPGDILVATDEGITVRLVQTIVDAYGAELYFRIEGFDLPAGEDPQVFPEVYVDGNSRNFSVSQTGGCSDGTMRNSAGEWVYTDGTPVQYDENDTLIRRYKASDGSLEYVHYIDFYQTDGRYFGKTMEVVFKGFGVQSEMLDGTMNNAMVTGLWRLKWTLTGTSQEKTVTLNQALGEGFATVQDVKLGQRSLIVNYQLRQYWEGFDTLDIFPHELRAVKMADGSQVLCVSSEGRLEGEDRLNYSQVLKPLDAILEVDKIEALIFADGQGGTVEIPLP